MPDELRDERLADVDLLFAWIALEGKKEKSDGRRVQRAEGIGRKQRGRKRRSQRRVNSRKEGERGRRVEKGREEYERRRKNDVEESKGNATSVARPSEIGCCARTQSIAARFQRTGSRNVSTYLVPFRCGTCCKQKRHRGRVLSFAVEGRDTRRREKEIEEAARDDDGKEERGETEEEREQRCLSVQDRVRRVDAGHRDALGMRTEPRTSRTTHEAARSS